MDKKTMEMIRNEFGSYADEIIARVLSGESIDSAIQAAFSK